MLNSFISWMHYTCLFWSNYFVFTILQIAFIFLCDDQRSVNNSKPLEGGWRKRYHDLYSMLLNRPRWWGTGIVSIPKHWSYKEDNPSSTPLSQRSRSFSFRNLKPLIITWGRVVLSVDPSAQRIASNESFQSKRQWWFRIIIKTGSHYQKKA